MEAGVGIAVANEDQAHTTTLGRAPVLADELSPPA
jgi:hypothetical protein